ncbi:uncharacterized protein LOC141590420 [Silene latifolia]|uniref:uncharacterized protein LOC141590420 n=1 Tax=Silene latifolia TaxID=37657 RepID=UPI003D76D2FE
MKYFKGLALDSFSSLLSSWIVHGKFKIDMAYNWFRTAQAFLPWARALKHQFILPNHSLVTSLAIQQQLATVDNLIGRGMIIPNRCILCKHSMENHSHLFFSCPFSHAVWTALLQWLGLDGRGSDCKTELLWSMQRSKRRHWKNGRYTNSIAKKSYYIWAERNARLFTGKEAEVEQLVFVIKSTVSTRILGKISTLHYAHMASQLSRL